MLRTYFFFSLFYNELWMFSSQSFTHALLAEQSEWTASVSSRYKNLTEMTITTSQLQNTSKLHNFSLQIMF